MLLDSGKVIGGLPLFEVKGFWGKRLVTSPFRDRGGLLAGTGVDPTPLINEAVRLCNRRGYDYLVIKEELPLGFDIQSNWGFSESVFWTTTIVDITEGSKSIWKMLKNNAQGPVKQAGKSGVYTRFAEDENDMMEFYRIFSVNRRSLGIPSFSQDFFSRIWKDMCQSGKAKLLLAFKGNTPIAGIVLLLHQNRVIDGYAAALPPYRNMRPNDLLVWEALKWASEKGYSLFDFGADSPRQENLLAFKRKWTGLHKPMHHYYFPARERNTDEMDSSDTRYAWARSVLARLPLPLFRAVSSFVVPRLG